ncbi:MAG: 3-phosphoshikimate 1-carboxyvinyltransferase, partial [Bacteroidetes bacterium]|nr:3-phosphoshikimate 1-carboxyvinyltransferase [Bacteroidota bacterium]
DYEWRDNIISVQHQSYHPKNISVESDWSAASYWYEMAAFADEVDLVITGLQQHSIQGDCVIAELMKLFGVETEFTNTGIRLIKTSTSLLPKEFSFDFQNCPDLVPAMAVTCSGIGVEASFTGVKNLRIKETDRLNALKNELEKAGTSCEISENDFRIHGYKKYFVPTSFFQTYHDHRMAMSLAPLALKFKKVEIENPGVVRKSYPEFWEDLRTVGFEISEDQN